MDTRPDRSAEIVALLSRILVDVNAAYGSLTAPRFEFVCRAISADPYRVLFDRLGDWFEVTEDTDPNDDVSFGALLRKGERRFLVRASMIGRYAVILLPEGHRAVPLDPFREGMGADECRIVDAMRESKVEILTREILEVPVQLSLYNTASEHVRVYQAIFVDTDMLPWAPV